MDKYELSPVDRQIYSRRLKKARENVRKALGHELIKNSGKVRFDDYMRIHLYYFYKNIVPEKLWMSLSHFDFFADYICEYLKDNPNILEIGGGSGLLASKILKKSDDIKRYILLEQSYPLFNIQFGSTRLGGKKRDICETFLISLQDLVEKCGTFLKNDDNWLLLLIEVFDTFPARVFRFGEGNIEKELYIAIDPNSNKNEPRYYWDEVGKDDFYNVYQEFVKNSVYDIQDGDIISISPYVLEFLEVIDSMKRGDKILIIDYGFDTDEDTPYRRYKHQYPNTGKGIMSKEDLNKILHSPILPDCTCGVDFGFIKWYLDKYKKDVSLKCRPLVNFVDKLLKSASILEKMLFKKNFKRFLALEITKK